MLDKQKCDRLKIMVKKLLADIDSKRDGCVPTDVFKQICALHNIRLDEASIGTLQRECKG